MHRSISGSATSRSFGSSTKIAAIAEAPRRSIDKEQPLALRHGSTNPRCKLAKHNLRRFRGDSPSAAIHHGLATFRGCGERVDEGDRDIILMRHHEQLSNQDVATAFKLTEAAASMPYLRAASQTAGGLVPDAGQSKSEGEPALPVLL